MGTAGTEHLYLQPGRIYEVFGSRPKCVGVDLGNVGDSPANHLCQPFFPDLSMETSQVEPEGIVLFISCSRIPRACRSKLRANCLSPGNERIYPHSRTWTVNVLSKCLTRARRGMQRYTTRFGKSAVCGMGSCICSACLFIRHKLTAAGMSDERVWPTAVV